MSAMSNKGFHDAVKSRRSIYSISKDTNVSDETIEQVIKHSVLHVPSAFNSQSARVVLLMREQSDKLWSITKEKLRPLVPADNFSSTEAKVDSFGSGIGTVLFFEDQTVVEGLQKQFELYKDNFPIWSLQSTGMLQFTVWTALEAEGLGASLQHYNPLIDDEVKKQWDLPDSWRLMAQMPFGHPVAPAGEKEFSPIEDRFKIVK